MRERAAFHLNGAVVSLLEEEFGPYHDLDDLAGSWVREEAEKFEEVLREQRTVDPDAWA